MGGYFRQLVQWIRSLNADSKKSAARQGFTLIEIIVVIGLLGLLAMAGLASYTSSQKRSRDSRRKIDLETIRQGLELYKSQIGSYPAVAGNTESVLKPVLSPTYIGTDSFPKDPLSSGQYYYESTLVNTYSLCTLLELPIGTETNCVLANEDCGTAAGNQDCNMLTLQP